MRLLLRLLGFPRRGRPPALASGRAAGTGSRRPGPRYLDGLNECVLYPARAGGGGTEWRGAGRSGFGRGR